ncbi:outer membrane beta-barrel protein [Paraferrimonas haliotis]|uniref:Outer membrane protein n=1 Tax=Paraferrimonas haliotis TaxID=2013866 RepID=A0AA37TV29_9GAMM|nr:outer membrane beta-barrel protein [Paraferrimonas haliotis]GLS82391.1 outer membrane protein [Paraferrimonas haliotis]
MKITPWVFALALVTPFAQADWYIAPFGGYSSGGNIDVENEQDEIRQELKIKETEHYGLKVGFTTNDPGSMYLLISSQSTEFQERTGQIAPSGNKVRLDYYHLGGNLYFAEDGFRPYVGASVGATLFKNNGGVSNETRFSFGLSGGGLYEITNNFGLFAEVQGFATLLNSDKQLFCDGAQGCLWRVKGSTMLQAQANVGFQVTF